MDCDRGGAWYYMLETTFVYNRARLRRTIVVRVRHLIVKLNLDVS